VLAHNVYFTLKDNSPAARTKLVAACKKYLTGHPGTVFFACGTVCDELRREVNDLGFDVGLHVIFATKADHDRYQDARGTRSLSRKTRRAGSRCVFDSVVEDDWFGVVSRCLVARLKRANQAREQRPQSPFDHLRRSAG
jgi:hypothetical protein